MWRPVEIMPIDLEAGDSVVSSAPRVSVGMPVYNGERWISAAIDSILGQTYRDLELVICDNASTDATADICRAYAARDPRVRYYRNSTNVGVFENYNRVFRHAAGNYFKWASSNDICADRFIERCVEVLDTRTDVVLCCGRTALIGERVDEFQDYDDRLDLQDASPCTRLRKFLAEIRLNNVFNGVVRAQALARTGLLRAYFSSDIALFAELAMRGKFVQLPERLFFRRMTADSATKLTTAERLREYQGRRGGARILFGHWKLCFGYLGAVTRAPLTVRERACAYRRVLRELIWSRRKLAADVYDALGRLFIWLRPATWL